MSKMTRVQHGTFTHYSFLFYDSQSTWLTPLAVTRFLPFFKLDLSEYLSKDILIFALPLPSTSQTAPH
jgi:hypothetical protein